MCLFTTIICGQKILNLQVLESFHLQISRNKNTLITCRFTKRKHQRRWWGHRNRWWKTGRTARLFRMESRVTWDWRPAIRSKCLWRKRRSMSKSREATRNQEGRTQTATHCRLWQQRKAWLGSISTISIDWWLIDDWLMIDWILMIEKEKSERNDKNRL